MKRPALRALLGMAALGVVGCPVYGDLGQWERVAVGIVGGTGASSATCPAEDAGAGAPIWSQGYGSPNGAGATSVAVDAAGDLIVAGSFQGSIDFGCTSLASSGGALFVAKLSPSGACLWSVGVDGSMAQVTSVAVDAMGNVFVTGSFEDAIDFGAGELMGAGMGSVFVAKLDPSGVPVWNRSFGDGQSQGASLAVDSMGNVIVVGSFTGSIDFGGSTTGIDGGTGDELFVAKLDPGGAAIWSKGLANIGGAGVAADPTGTIMLTGDFVGSVDLGGCPLTGTDPQDGFVAKLAPGGECLWSTSLGTAAGASVAVDAGGNVVVTGGFAGSVSFGGETFTSTGGVDNLFLAKLDPSGALLWGKGFAGGDAAAGGSAGVSVVLDRTGDVFVTGVLDGTIDFGGGTSLASAGVDDILLVSFDANGDYRWAKRFGDAQDTEGAGIAVGPSCHVVIVGAFEGTFDFGGNPLVSPGANNAFVAAFGP